jgi:NAD(P) transhydrogenase
VTSAADGTVRHDYDLLVIGSGPGGQKAAIAAAKLGKRVAVVERRGMVGGVCTQTGTIPSKTLREAVLYLTGYAMRGLYGESYRVKQDITVQDLLARTHFVIGREVEVIRAQLQRNRVDLLSGSARFLDPHAVEVVGEPRGARSDGGRYRGEHQTVTADKIVIATGTRPARRRPSSSTTAASSTPTASSPWRRSRRAWSSSAPASSASSTPRCSPRSAPA